MKALIIGAARSGIAITKLLVKEGYECILLDQKSVDKTQFDALDSIQIIEGPHPISLWNEQFDLIIKNPGISHKNRNGSGSDRNGQCNPDARKYPSHQKQKDFPEWIRNIPCKPVLPPCPGKIPGNRDLRREPDGRNRSRNQKDISSKDCENIRQDEAAGRFQFQNGC